MSEAARAPEGQIIDQRYRIVSKIAEGGMATVYRAVDLRLERSVAIKIMHMQLAQGPHRDQFVQRFHREVKSAASMANPHIVQVYDTGEFHGLDYLVMEYVHGVNLRHEMNAEGTFTVRETLRVIRETLDGLASAHASGIVHRDIKPENILLNDRGHVEITDFGLAKATSEATLSSTGMLLGTAAYLAPETIEGNRATSQGDLYSVGIMAWEMLAGAVPFTSANPVTLVFKHVHEDVPPLNVPCPGIDPEVVAFIAHLTERSIEGRPADAGAALQELTAMATRLAPDAWLYRKAAADPSPGGDAADPTSVNPTASGASERNGAPTHASNGQERPTRPQPPEPPSASRTSQRSPDPTQIIASRTPQTRPTRALDALGNRHADVLASASPTRGSGTAPWRRRRTVILTLSIVLALGLCTCAGLWWYFRGPGSYWTVPKPGDLRCSGESACTITDVKWSSYETLLRNAGIPYTAAHSYSDTIAQGSIIGTYPSTVDAHVGKRSSSVMKITVSRGVRQATIPSDILDTSSEHGKNPLSALRKAGFSSISHDVSKDVYSLDLPAGTVQSIDPKPGTTMRHNKEIVIHLSKGPMPVSMPSIVGHSRDEAQTAFDDAKLEASYTEEYSDTVASGKVISASVEAGRELHWGDSVSVVVSKGPQTVTVPKVVGMSTDDAERTLRALGLDVKVTAPLGDITHTVRLQSPEAGQQVRVRDSHGDKTVITLTVV
ncbi:MAG: PASTA domain-containing protein [Bifidobacterium sp.]|jgi:serine/threonine protein kinase/beta-lactam-binding protein with PASTA domain